MLDGIAEMFAELDGYTNGAYDAAVERYVAWARHTAVERTRQWRIANPEMYRAQRKRSKYNWSVRYPEKARAAKARYRDKHRAQLREVWRRNTAAYRARKRLAGLAL